jgi:hypothetical protein
MVIFDQWKKLCLGLNAEAEIQLLNCIYLIYRSSPRASRTLSIIVLVLVTVYAMGPSIKYIGNWERANYFKLFSKKCNFVGNTLLRKKLLCRLFKALR